MSDDRFIMKTSRTTALAPLPHSIMKKILLFLAFALSCVSGQSAGVISVPSGGVGPLDFSQSASNPPTNGWSTFSFTGAGADWANDTTIDGAVGAHPASDFNLVLPQSTTQPPSTSTLGFRYNYGGLF